MFLHLGGNMIVPKKDVVAILDIRTGSSAITAELLQTAAEEGFVVQSAGADKKKTYVITSNKIYYSSISCTTLKKRALDDY
ncbi:MAG: DUF370 domain-containing protein [Firmicutes bacterium]|nr:DUF370 domain-containing protein [Bacillota bacterium]